MAKPLTRNSPTGPDAERPSRQARRARAVPHLSARKATGHLAFFGQPAKCEVAHTSFRLAPLKSGMATSVWWPGGDTMAPKPEPAGLAYVFGIVLAVAAILAIMGWVNRYWAAPSSSPIYHPQHLIVY